MNIQRKPSIALVVDVKGWAFYNIATQIVKSPSTDFDFNIYYCGYKNSLYQKEQLNNNVLNLYKASLYEKLFLKKKHDLVFFFSRRELDNIFDDDFIHLYSHIDNFLKLLTNFISTTVATGVYDHMYLFPEEIESKRNLINVLSDEYIVCSNKLFKIYSQLPKYKQPSAIIQDGVDLSLFYPKNIKRFKNTDRKLVFGWAGNSKWTGAGLIKEKIIDNKGFNSVIKPALKILEDQKIEFEINIADRNIMFLPLEKMIDFYKNIDVLICSSVNEGTPNPVLEAMACGVPVVSTDVGIIPEILGSLQRKFIYKRSPKALAQKLTNIINHPEILSKLSYENLKQIKKFTRYKESLEWKKFFQQALANKQKQTQTEFTNKYNLIVPLFTPLMEN